MFEVRLSEIDGRVDDFRVVVETHIARLTAFNKEIGKPRPVAPPLVEGCIMRVQTKGQPDSYVADYTIVDDRLPTTSPFSLDDKKTQLHSKLSVAEIEAKNKITPPRKRRLAELQYQDAVIKKEEDRSPEEIEAVNSFITMNKKWTAASLIAAKAEFAIEDLTEDNIDNWQLPSFEVLND